MSPEQEPDNLKLKQIRTFQGDVAEALRKQEESLVSIQQAEHQKKGFVPPTVTTPEEIKGRKNLFFLVTGSFVLFVLGTIGAWYAYIEYGVKTAPPSTNVPANRFISADSESNLDLATTSRENFVGALTSAIENVSPGELKHVFLKKAGAGGTLYPISTSEFFASLESRAPGSLVRAFSPIFMFGTLGSNPFLIIKLVSFDNAFAGMLAWEKNMVQDIGPVISRGVSLSGLVQNISFTDVTDRNEDIRALMFEGQNVLLYSFFGNKMLIITKDIETLRTLIDRLTRENLSR